MAELFGCPFKGSGGGGGWGVTSHMLAIIPGCAAQMGGFYIKKICKHVSHFDPKKRSRNVG